MRAGSDTAYRWAQVDDYIALPRRALHAGTAALALRARVSNCAGRHLGLWGWDDPFANEPARRGSAAAAGAPNRLVLLSLPPNHLTLRDGAPGHGFLAQTFVHTYPSLLLHPAGWERPAWPGRVWAVGAPGCPQCDSRGFGARSRGCGPVA